MSELTLTIEAELDWARSTPRNHLTVIIAGTGVGSVTSAPAGIACPGDCEEFLLVNSTIVLTATPDANSDFIAWSGDVPIGFETVNPLTLTMDQDRTVTATFNVEPILTITLAGTGTGLVTSNVGGISCSPTCSAQYDVGTVVLLTATPDPNMTFAGWSGDVPAGHENDNPLSITMNANKAITATFNIAFVGGAWIMRPPTSATVTYNATTQRFIALVHPLLSGAAVGSAGEADFRAPRSFIIRSLWILLNAAQPGGASATFKFNINGVTQADALTIGAGASKGGITLSQTVTLDDKLCLECTATAGGFQAIKAIGVGWKELKGTVIA